MTRRVLDVNAHNGIFATHALRSKSDCIDSIFKQTLHFCRALIVIVGTDRTHQRFLGKQCRCLHGGCYANAHKKRRTCIDSIGSHDIEYELGNTLITFARH